MRVPRRKAKAGRRIAVRVEEMLLSAIDAEVARLRHTRDEQGRAEQRSLARA